MRASRWAVVWAVAVIGTVARHGQAQEVTPGRLICGEHQLPLDGLDGAVGDASLARRAQIERLYGFVSKAAKDCDAAANLPGCGRLQELFGKRALGNDAWTAPTGEGPAQYDRRVAALASDLTLELEARRVLAYQTCLDDADQLSAPVMSQLATTCGDLLRAENATQDPARRVALVHVAFLVPGEFAQVAAAVPVPPPSPPSDAVVDLVTESLLDHQAATAPVSTIIAGLPATTRTVLRTPGKKKADALKAFRQQARKPVAGCEGKTMSATCAPNEEQRQEVVSAIDVGAAIKHGLEVLEATPGTDDVYNLARKLVADTSVTPVPVTEVPAAKPILGAAQKAFLAEYKAVNGWNACSQADYYVGADGLRSNNARETKLPKEVDKPLTLCVSVPSYALDNPFAVKITQARRQSVVQAWPGEVTPLNVKASDGDVAHIEVRGFAGGDALRALARQSSLLDKGQSTEELSAQAAGVAASRRSLESDVKTANAERLIAARVESDTTLATTAAQLSMALQSAAVPATTWALAESYGKRLLAILADIRSRTAAPENDSRAIGVAFSLTTPVPLPANADLKTILQNLIGFASQLRVKADAEERAIRRHRAIQPRAKGRGRSGAHAACSFQ